MASSSHTEKYLEECEADVSCSPTQLEGLCGKFHSHLNVQDVIESDESESDKAFLPTIGNKLRAKRNANNPPVTSTTDSSFYGDNLTSLPSKTSGWNIYCLESLGIFYNESYHSSPLDILDMIFDELKIFGTLTEDQKVYMDSLQKCMIFSTSIIDIIHDKENIVQNEDGDIYLPALEKDIQNLSDPSFKSVEDFLIRVQLMISCQTAFLNGLRETGVPEDVFVKILEMFAEMCHILPVPGSAKKCVMSIQTTTVKSASDVVLIPKRYRQRAFAVDTACIVSIVEVKKVERSRMVKPQQKKAREMRSALDSDQSESPVKAEPQIYQKVHQRFLGQHGGELLVHRDIYGGTLSKGRIWKYLPGMICIGTEVIFTLLKIKGAHLRALTTMSRLDAVKPNLKATIFYSKPKDMLRMEDRNILVESFLRLNNIDKTPR